jgi:hypothetical protein
MSEVGEIVQIATDLLCLSLLNLDVGKAEPATGCVGQGPRRRTRAVLLVDMLTSTCLLRARSVPDQRSRDSKKATSRATADQPSTRLDPPEISLSPTFCCASRVPEGHTIKGRSVGVKNSTPGFFSAFMFRGSRLRSRRRYDRLVPRSP